jgi:hypothetical protein
MPITLGDTSITGLGVGTGIPANALSGRIPASNANLGSMLQVVHDHNYIASESAVSVGSFYNFNTISITPRSNNSRILCMCNPTFYSRTSDGGGSPNTKVYVQDITNSNQILLHEWMNYSDNRPTTDGLRLKYPFMYFFDNTVTTQRQFRFRAEATLQQGRVGGENMVTTICIEFQL